MLTVVDVEVTFQGKWNAADSDPTAYNPLNRLVTVGYQTTTGEKDYLVFHHKEFKGDRASSHKQLQDVLNRSKLVIGHNLKFDMTWLYESGFSFDGGLYDTMIFEYINARGLQQDLSLAGTLSRYGLEAKLDILSNYCSTGFNVDEVPLDELIKYGQADVSGTFALYRKQVELLRTDLEVASMKAPLKMMNEFLAVLIDVERNGVRIDIDALNKVEEDFRRQHESLEARLKYMVQKVMGHTPINLGSPEQISWVLHSKKVKDKELWKTTFNLGTEERNGVKKAKYNKRYSPKEFKEITKTQMTTLKKTRAEQCPECHGKGYIQLLKKDGEPRKNMNVCHACEKSGIKYIELPEIAGFKIPPISYDYASDGGFSSGKDVLDELLALNINDDAKDFIETYKSYNAISSYLTSFIEGIRKNVEDNLLLHTNFNQCITATGRLSSTRPNLQNQPRQKTFPIRKVFISRFPGGCLINADFSQLEFRVAAFEAQDRNAIEDIINNIDVHTQTMKALLEGGEKIDRDGAKKYTFRPLFGGTSGTEAQLTYFTYFFSRYTGIFSWHEQLCNEAIEKKYIQSPSGRIYAFPNVKRKTNGSVSFATQIKNYPVQGFATGDILPVTMIEMHRLMKEAKVRSRLVLTVHDSIVADVHPEEVEVMIEVFKAAFKETIPLLKERFNVDFNIPLEYELDMGPNLLEKKKIPLDKAA